MVSFVSQDVPAGHVTPSMSQPVAGPFGGQPPGWQKNHRPIGGGEGMM